MESFNEILTRWQPFFSTVAGVSATLAGLLFVSLSLNREKITAEESRVFLRLAQRSFGDLLFVLFIALMFLVPNHVPYGLAVPLFIVVAVRGCWFLRSVCRSSGGASKHLTAIGVLREQVFQTLSWLGLLAAAVEIYRGNLLGTFLLVPVIALLLYNASMNAWLLLIMEKSANNVVLDPTLEGEAKKAPSSSLK